jgi:hypothetical protein
MKANTANIHNDSFRFHIIQNKTLPYGRSLLQKPVNSVKSGEAIAFT